MKIPPYFSLPCKGDTADFSKIVSALKILGPVKLDTQKLHEALSIKCLKYFKDVRYQTK